MTLQERMQAVLDFSGLTIPQLARNVGFKTPQTIREILKGNTRTLSDAVRYRLLSYYPTLNAEWLTTGEGEMFTDKVKDDLHVQPETPPMAAPQATITIPSAVWQVIQQQADSLAARDRQIDALIDLYKREKGDAHQEGNATSAVVG